MEINLRIHVGNPDPEALQALFDAAKTLENGYAGFVTQSQAYLEGATNTLGTIAETNGLHQHDGELIATEAAVASASSAASAPASSAASAPVKGKPGRKKKGELTANEPQADAGATPPGGWLPPGGPTATEAAPGNSSAPTPTTGGLPPPAFATQQQQPAPQTAEQPAMPTPAAAASGAGAAAAGTEMPLEMLRKAVIEVNTARVGLPMKIMRAGVWSDGSVKAWQALTLENIPPAERDRFVSEMQQLALTA